MDPDDSGTRHVLDSLPDYALGCLSAAEGMAVREHLAGCTICRSELRAFRAVTEQLALAVPGPVEPSPDLRRQLMTRIRELDPSAPARPVAVAARWRVPRWPLWGVAAALLILALGVVNVLLWQQLTDAEVLASPQGMQAVALRSTGVAPRASGVVVIGGDGRNGVLVVDAMPQLDPARAYQLWLIRDDENTSGAVFSVDESGYRGVRISAPDSLLSYSAARITIEPAEGSAFPTGESVMNGLLPQP